MHRCLISRCNRLSPLPPSSLSLHWNMSHVRYFNVEKVDSLPLDKGVTPQSWRNTSFYIDEVPRKSKSALYHEGAAAFHRERELLACTITNDHFTIRKSDSKIWLTYTAGGIGIGSALCMMSGCFPFAFFVGLYFTSIGGYSAQIRKHLFHGDNAQATRMFDLVINYMLINNAQLSLRPWKGDLLDKYDDLYTSLTGYTSLQQLMVKEPIINRNEKPRVVSSISARTICTNLLKESFFYVKEVNPWEDQISASARIYLKFIRLAEPLKDKDYAVERRVDGTLKSFDLFYESFHSHATKLLTESANHPKNTFRIISWTLCTGILCGSPLILLFA